MSHPAFSVIDVVRVNVADASRVRSSDRAAVEDPLEIRIHRRPFAVVMRTPGADRELTAGFLLAEQVLTSPEDLGTLDYCEDVAEPGGQAINVTLARATGNTIDRLLADRRQVVMNAACGLCGRLTLDSLRLATPPLERTWCVDAAVIAVLPERLRAGQAVFNETGGLHAAGLFSPSGALETLAEDVGRHNAVDKVIGRRMLMDEWPVGDRLLFVSGRTSYEIVQKAALAGIPMIASVSAPSSLAIAMADELGISLIGFVRGAAFNVYTHAGRIV
jgi:FdhD protein